jgi:hypothetical protein
MDCVNWNNCERLIRPLNEAEKLAVFLAQIRAGQIEEQQIAIAAAAMGLAWSGSPVMPERSDDLGAWGTECLSVMLKIGPWHEVVPDLWKHLAHVVDAYTISEDEVAEAAGNSEGDQAAPSATV